MLASPKGRCLPHSLTEAITTADAATVPTNPATATSGPRLRSSASQTAQPTAVITPIPTGITTMPSVQPLLVWLSASKKTMKARQKMAPIPRPQDGTSRHDMLDGSDRCSRPSSTQWS